MHGNVGEEIFIAGISLVTSDQVIHIYVPLSLSTHLVLS